MLFANGWSLSINHQSLLPIARRVNQLLEKIDQAPGVITKEADATVQLILDRQAATSSVERTAQGLIITGTCTKATLRTAA